MATLMAEQESTEQMFDWLNAQATAQNAAVRLHTAWAEEEGRFLIIPARVSGDLDAYDKANILQQVEDSWNNRDPAPYRVAILRPTSK